MTETTVDEVVVTGKRPKRNRLKALFGNPRALLEGAKGVPGALVNALGESVASGDLMRFGEDIVRDPVGALDRAASGALSSFGREFRRDPAEALLGLTPFGDAKDIADTRAQAQEARDRGDAATARRLETAAATMTPLMLAGMVPGAKPGLKTGAEGLAKNIAERKLSPLNLYSHAAEVARNLPQEKGTPQQVEAMLLRSGVKPAEIRWSGYREVFGDRPSVTKDEVAKHFDEQLLGVEREPPKARTLGVKAWIPSAMDETAYSARDPKSALDRWGNPRLDAAGGEPLALNVGRDAGPKPLSEEDFDGGNPTNYSEILLRGPSPYQTQTVEIAQRQHSSPSLERLKWPRVAYRAPHWEHDPNTYAHIRVLDRDVFPRGTQAGEWAYDLDTGRRSRPLSNDPLGSSTHLEELQSDWAQQLRANKQERDPYEPPVGPYVESTNDWVDLGLKRALTEAARRQSDYFTWTPGALQARRYNQDIPIRELHYRTVPVDVDAIDADRLRRGLGALDTLDEERARELISRNARALGGPESWRPGEPLFSIAPIDYAGTTHRLPWSSEHMMRALALWTPDLLEKRIGEPLTRALVERSRSEPWGVLETPDLIVGPGKGSREFYDRIVPKRINEVLKPFGVQPEMDMFSLYAGGSGGASGSEIANYFRRPWEDIVDSDEHDALFERYNDERQFDEVPGFGLDPETRQRILTEGFKAYAKGGLAEIDRA
ncbi:MAG: hypothetical protein RI988_3500 [Pseudomonadota bacterium]